MIASEVVFTIIIVSPLNSCHWNPFYISLHQVLYLPKQYRKKIEEKRNHNNTCDDVIPSSLSTFFTKILVLVLF